MKKHIQIRNSYAVWHPSMMAVKIHVQAKRKGYGQVHITKAIVVEWWLHNIGYHLTLPFIKNPRIKALNERFKHVDLMVKTK